jgi:hypothetical protein
LKRAQFSPNSLPILNSRPVAQPDDQNQFTPQHRCLTALLMGKDL